MMKIRAKEVEILQKYKIAEMIRTTIKMSI